MIKGKYKREAYFFICDMLSVVNRYVPKQKNKVLFFSNSELEDNSKALLDHLLADPVNKAYNIVCSVSEPNKYKHYKRENVNFVSVIASLYHIMTAKRIFFHGEIIAIKPSKKQISINLWHGTPLKKFNKTAEKLSDYRYNFFTYVLASSEAFRPIMRDCFDCHIDQVVVFGHPRNDLLFQKGTALQKLNINKTAYKKIFLWMPTFRISRDHYIVDIEEGYRTETGLRVMRNEADLRTLNSKLQEMDSFMLIKLHPAQNLDYVVMKEFTNILFLTNTHLQKASVDLYQVLREADALITDYSSVYFDYLLLDRPIGFTIDDFRSYQNARGFLFENPLDYMPGRKIETKEDFFQYMDDVLEGNDDYKDQRAKVNELANQYKDSRNSERILQFAGIK